MSELDNAINSINASATKASKTASFLDQLGTYDENSNVTNPNNGAVVPSIQKKVKDTTEELFANAESDINAAVATATGAVNFAGAFVSGSTSAIAGKSYSFDGGYWTCVANTTSTPSLSNSAWRKVIGQGDIDAAEERAIGAGVSIFRGSNGSYVQNGDVVPVGTTHLTVLINGKPEDVAIAPVASGTVADLTETSATIGGVGVALSPWFGSLTNYQAASVDDMITGKTIGGDIVPHRVGQVWGIYGQWRVKSVSDPMTINDFYSAGLANVKDFGVVYDSVSDAASNAIKINQMFTDGISSFYFPSGNVWLGDGLNFENRSYVTIAGDGTFKTNIRFTEDVVDYGVKIGNHAGSYQSGGGIKGVSLWGTYISNTGDWTTSSYRIEKMIFAGGWVNRADITDVTINRAKTGYYNETFCWDRTFQNVLIDETSDYGIYMGAAGNAVHYSQLMVFRFQGYGGFFKECYGTSFDACSFEAGMSTGDQVSMHIEPFGGSMTGCYFEGNSNHLRVACAGWESDPTGNNGIYRSKGFNVSGNYFTSVNDPSGTTIQMVCAGGVDVSSNLIRGNTNGVTTDSFCLNNNLSHNDFLSVTNPYDLSSFKGTVDQQGVTKHETTGSNLTWNLYTQDRSGSASSIVRVESTLNNSSQVSINRNSNSYRTWLSAQTGTGGGVLPVASRAGDTGTPNLGSASARWDTVYSNNVLNTSDVRLKTSIEPIPESICHAAMEIELVRFKMKESVASKGESDARWHYGVIAQQANDVFEKYGVDLATNGMLGFDNLDDTVTLDDGSEMSDIYLVRYNEFQVVLLQALKLEIESIKASREAN